MINFQIKDLASYSYCSCNELFMHEVVLEFNPTFWQCIRGKPGDKHTLIALNTLDTWYDKETLKPVSKSMRLDILEVIDLCKLLKRLGRDGVHYA